MTTHDSVLHQCWGPLAAIVLAAAAGIAGCGRPLPPPAAENLHQALTAYEQGDDAAVIDRTSQIIANFSRSPETAEAYYLRALARIRRDDAAGGQQDLQKALALARRDDLAARAHLALGLLADTRGDPNAARQQYVAAVERFACVGGCCDAHEEALCRLGLLLQTQGEFLEADRYFDRLLHLYCQGRWSALARQQIRGQAWTLRAGSFSSLDEARQKREELEKAGREAQVVPVHCPDVSFEVRVGRYKTYQEAQVAMGEVPGAQIVVER
jgi:tetratricopeptide (TPR) repeat protein